METDEPNIVEEGVASNVPISPSVFKNSLISGMLGGVLSIVIILIIYILDDTIKTSDDIEKYLGLNTLAEIPLAKDAKKNKRSKHKLVTRMEVGD
jgi:capsular polysaccharide biosynthesis protein